MRPCNLLRLACDVLDVCVIVAGLAVLRGAEVARNLLPARVRRGGS